MSDVCWIHLLDESHLHPDERASYDQVRRADGSVHNLYRAYSAWSKPMLPAHRLYKAIMHAADSPLSFTLCELIATHVAKLVGCEYAFRHHGENLRNLLDDTDKSEAIFEALEDDDIEAAEFSKRTRAMLIYNKKLTLNPSEMTKDDVEKLRSIGLSEREILQLNQISSSFNYWVRVINGLGIQVCHERVGMESETLLKIDSRRKF